MPTLLYIDSSPMGRDSISRRLTAEFVERWLEANPQGLIIRRDLASITIPVIDAEWVAANYTPKERRTEQQNEILSLSDELTADLLEADEYVIGVRCTTGVRLPFLNCGWARSSVSGRPSQSPVRF